jgi:hypothetical protein
VKAEVEETTVNDTAAGQPSLCAGFAPQQLPAYTGRHELSPNLIFEVTTRAGHLFV